MFENLRVIMVYTLPKQAYSQVFSWTYPQSQAGIVGSHPHSKAASLCSSTGTVDNAPAMKTCIQIQMAAS